ncbi:MAG: flagellar hook assembly protein FlgD [Thermoguttaceae bacterium]
MTSISNNTQNYSSATSATNDRFNELGPSDFLKLMVAELQNQDPLQPMDNAQMLAQIGQIRQITANDQLTKTLESVSLGQSIATASSLIGKTVTGTDVLGETISGKVDRVVFDGGKPRLHVGNTIVPVENVSSVEATT